MQRALATLPSSLLSLRLTWHSHWRWEHVEHLRDDASLECGLAQGRIDVPAAVQATVTAERLGGLDAVITGVRQEGASGLHGEGERGEALEGMGR
jgi:hypothetical protein